MDQPVTEVSSNARAIPIGEGVTVEKRRTLRLVSIALLALCTAFSSVALLHACLGPSAAAEPEAAPDRLLGTAAALATVLGVVALVMEVRFTAQRSYSFAPVRKLFYLAVATWIGYLFLAQPYHRMKLELWVTVGAGAFLFLRTIEPALARLPHKLRRGADIAIFNVCLTLVLGELGLRTLAFFKPSPIFARVGGTPMELLENNRQPPGTLRFLFPCNSRGEYDEEFVPRKPGEHLVITIGDSFSYGVVPHDYHFSTVCERSLGIPVYNMGVPAIGPPEYAYLLEHEALELDPEVVVIDIFVGNDLLFPHEDAPAFDPFLRTWFDRRNALLCLVPERLGKIAEMNGSRTADQGPLGSAQGENATAANAQRRTVEEQFPWIVDALQEVQSFKNSIFIEVETTRAMSVCRADSPPLDVFMEYLMEIKRLAGATPIVVMLIPDEFQVEDAVWQGVLERTAQSRLDRDRPQKILLPWFESSDIPCLDLLPLLRSIPPLADGRQHVYHLRDTHFNARGNRVAGEALAKFVREHWPHVCAK